MEFIRKNVFNIIMILGIILSIGLCVYTVGNYTKNTTNTNNYAQGDFQGSGKNQGQMPPDGIRGNASNSNINQNNSGNTNNKAQRPQFQGGNMNRGMSSSGSNKYISPVLIAYIIAFFGAFITLFSFRKKRRVAVSDENKKILIYGLLALGLLLRISLGLYSQGFISDINLFKNWATTAANNLTVFYSGSHTSDYPPFYIYVLFLTGKLASLSAISPYFTFLIKLPSIIADIVTAFFIYKIGKKYISEELSMLISIFYIFNPAIFINSTIWGQVDSFFTMIIVIAVYLMTEGKIALSSVVFTIGVLMKPQGIIYLPILFFELVRRKSIKSFFVSGISALITALIIILPFSITQGFTWIINLFANTIGEYPYASVNGYNFFALLGQNYTNDSQSFIFFSYHTWGTIFIILITLFTWFIYIKGNSKIIAPLAALIQIAGVFTFSTSMHERYLFPAAALALLAYIYIKDKRLLILAGVYSMTIYLNTQDVLFSSGNVMGSTTSGFLIFITSLINVIAFIYLGKIAWDIAVKKKVYELEENNEIS